MMTDYPEAMQSDDFAEAFMRIFTQLPPEKTAHFLNKFIRDGLVFPKDIKESDDKFETHFQKHYEDIFELFDRIVKYNFSGSIDVIKKKLMKIEKNMSTFLEQAAEEQPETTQD